MNLKKSLLALLIVLFVLFVLIPLMLWISLFIYDKDFAMDQLREITWHSKIDECKSIGEPILEALEKYRKENGAYPETLEMLVPEYMNDIPDHLTGNKKWEYRPLLEEDYYELSFSPSVEHHYPCCYFNSNYGKWYINE